VNTLWKKRSTNKSIQNKIHGRQRTVPKLALHFRFFRISVIYFIISGVMGILFSIPQVEPFTHKSAIAAGHIIFVFFGWVTMTIMGVMSKMVPTMLGKDLHSEQWGEVTFWLMNIGILGYSILLILEGVAERVYHLVLPAFTTNLEFLLALFIVAGGFSFAYNFYKTVGLRTAKVAEPSIGLSLKFFRMSIAYFLASIVIAAFSILGYTDAVFFGLSFARVLWVAPFTTLGWMTLTIMGAMYHLLPMFTISRVPNFKLANAQFYALNIGTVLTGVAGLLGAKRIILEGVEVNLLSVLQTVGVVAAGIGSALFVYIMAWIVLSRKRKELNISVKFYLVALFYFTLTGLFGVVLKTQQGYDFSEGTKIILGHGLLSVIGFVSLTIMGSIYSIIPMLAVVDLHARKKKVPSILTEMYNERLSRLSFWLSSVGVGGYITGLVGEGYVTATLTQQGASLAQLDASTFPFTLLSIAFVLVLGAGVLLFAYNVQKMYGWLKD